MTTKKLRFKKANLVFFPAFLILYVFGGVIQFTGILSQTGSNFLTIIILLYFIIYTNSINIDAPEIAILASVALLLIVGTINGSSAEGIFVYVYYCFCICISLYSAKILADHIQPDINRTFSIVSFILLMQIPILLLQIFYANEIAAASKITLIPSDTASGSFYLKSDSSLAFAAFLASSAAFLLKIRYRYLILLISISIAFLTNSKASQAAALIIFIVLIWQEWFFSRKTGRIFSTLVGAACFSIVLIAFSDIFKGILDGYFFELDKAYENRFKHETASRFAVLGGLLLRDLSLLGGGFLTYYSPINNTWLYYSGHSLIYSLIIDTGIIGLIVFIFGIYVFTIKSIKKKVFQILFLSIFLTFSFFNFSAADISFLFVYFFFTYLTKKRIYAES